MGVPKLNLAQRKEEFVKGSRKLNSSAKSFVKKTCTVDNLKKKIPITIWLPKYKLSHLFGDVLSGLTVALTVIPQSLALAQIADLPPNYGLYTAFMSCFVYCIFGSAKDVTIGPTAVMAILALQFGETPVPGNATYIVLLTFMTGIVQMAMGILNLGFAINFISFPVISAFTSAAAITVAWSQLKKIFGIRKLPKPILISIGEFFRRITETNYWDLIAGVICIVILVSLKKVKELSDDLSKKHDSNTPLAAKLCCKLCWIVGTARNAIVVLMSAGITAGLLSKNITVLTITGHIEPGLPPFKLPNFTLEYDNTTVTAPEIFAHLGAGIIIVPLISILETIAIGKALARKNNYRIDPNQEIIASGIANFLSSFVSAFPITASFSRSTVNSQTGVCTPATGIVTGGMVLLALGVLTPYFYYIPTVALAAVIIVAVLHMVDLGVICKLWRMKKIDLIPYLITFILSFILGIEYGIIIGIGVSLLMILYPMAKPAMRVKHEKCDDFDNFPSTGDDGIVPLTSSHDIIVLQPSLGLDFPCVESIHERVMEEASEDNICKGVVIDATHISNIDYTALQSVMAWHVELLKYDLKLVFACLQDDVKKMFVNANIMNFTCTDTVEQACCMIREDNPDMSFSKMELELKDLKEDVRNLSDEDNNDLKIVVEGDVESHSDRDKII